MAYSYSNSPPLAPARLVATTAAAFVGGPLIPLLLLLLPPPPFFFLLELAAQWPRGRTASRRARGRSFR